MSDVTHILNRVEQGDPKAAAELLQVSERTVERAWAFAKAWLFAAIQDCPPP